MKASLLENLELPLQYTVEEICRSLETNLRPLITSVQKEVDIAIYFSAPSTQYRIVGNLFNVYRPFFYA